MTGKRSGREYHESLTRESSPTFRLLSFIVSVEFGAGALAAAARGVEAPAGPSATREG